MDTWTMVMKDRLAGGAIQNRNIYQYNWFWCESFDGLKFHEHDDNAELGLDISQKVILYDVNAVTNNLFTWTYNIFGVTQRVLTIKKNSVIVV